MEIILLTFLEFRISVCNEVTGGVRTGNILGRVMTYICSLGAHRLALENFLSKRRLWSTIRTSRAPGSHVRQPLQISVHLLLRFDWLTKHNFEKLASEIQC